MKQKYLRVTMPDGSRWDIPVMVIVKHRAKYFGEKDPEMRGEYEIMDYATNNMNWGDVVLHAQEVIKPEPDYQEGWINGNKEIIEK